MITSMTGFGRGESSSNGYQVTVEIKTLNSRYLDVSVRMPGTLQDKEIELKECVQKHLSRGKVNVNINVDKSKGAGIDIKLNEELAQSYSSILNDLRSAGSIDQPVTVQDLMQFNDIFETKKEDEEEVKIIWECTKSALVTALENLNTMRRNEGQELKDDLSNLITGISELLDEVTILSDKRAPEVREKLKTRITKMVTEEQIDPDRMEMEIALLVDKMDINEEIIRLQSHLKFFLEALEADEPVGRRLNFLCQEINRELNTIGSKANDSTVAHHIVLGKEKLEQIREQVQNIE
ncbi:YicC/YloC family endoribonuclease [Rhodohalobacter halophilus]|uniref:YicC/YloC family endoribonuclease n=1 Tax=Rhodohalobacter halophilus TaxID=1812810 RepID=UPI00083FAFDE|nr:YicC/YloC family endoribonuclease [Rhodohalobacter halophilus]